VAYDYTAAGPELLTNGGFETAGDGGVDIWAGWTEEALDGALANETGSRHGGDDAAKITAGSAMTTHVWQAITVVPGQVYTFSFWTRGDGTNAGRYAVYDVTNGAYIYNWLTTGVSGATYVQDVVTITVPAGCISAYIMVCCPPLNGGIAYFDDVTVTLTAHDIVGDVPARINALGMRKGNAEAGSLYRV